MSIASSWKKRQARNRAKVEASKRARTLKPGAREVFAVRIQAEEAHTDRRGVRHIRLVTQPWPKGFTSNDVLLRVLSAGIR